MIIDERRNRFLGERMEYNGQIGVVIGIYPCFVLLRGNKYNFTINYKDMGIKKKWCRMYLPLKK